MKRENQFDFEWEFNYENPEEASWERRVETSIKQIENALDLAHQVGLFIAETIHYPGGEKTVVDTKDAIVTIRNWFFRKESYEILDFVWFEGTTFLQTANGENTNVKDIMALQFLVGADYFLLNTDVDVWTPFDSDSEPQIREGLANGDLLEKTLRSIGEQDSVKALTRTSHGPGMMLNEFRLYNYPRSVKWAVEEYGADAWEGFDALKYMEECKRIEAMEVKFHDL